MVHQMAQTANNYFIDIFTTNASSHADNEMQEWTQEAQMISEDPYTNSIPDCHELHNIIKNMRSNVAPGPYGLNAGFYKAAWSWIGNGVLEVVKNFILLQS